MNADGHVDISDAVYLLSHLFVGGPAPMCRGALPDTGQTQCYDSGGTEVPCNPEISPGQDGLHATGCPTEGRFIDNGDGTVSDACTGLMWQQDTADVSRDGQVNGDDSATWQEAVQYCENLDLAGQRDWRLPNRRELESLIDAGRYEPAVDPTFLAETSWYWSSTALARSPGSKWYVSFVIGEVGSIGRFTPMYVRAVRTIQLGK